MNVVRVLGVATVAKPRDVHADHAPEGPAEGRPGRGLKGRAVAPRPARLFEGFVESCGTSLSSPIGPRRWRGAWTRSSSSSSRSPSSDGPDLRPDPLLRDQVPPGLAGRRSDAVSHNVKLEVIWVTIPLAVMMVMFVWDGWSTSSCSGRRPAPPRCTSWGGSGCGRSGTRREARDQRTAPPGGPAGAAPGDLAGT